MKFTPCQFLFSLFRVSIESSVYSKLVTLNRERQLAY